MELSNLVQFIESKIKEYRAKVPTPKPSQGKDYFYNLEAHLSFRELDDVVSQLKAYNQNSPINQIHIDIIAAFFEHRWNRIKSTDAAPFIKTRQPMTTFSESVLVYLTKCNDLTEGKSMWQLLMPTVKSWYIPKSGHHMNDYPLHRFLLSEDNERVFEMSYLAVVAQHGVLSLAQVEAPDKEIPLTAKEVEMVRNHSSSAKAYYDAITAARPDKEAIQSQIRPAYLASLSLTAKDHLPVTATYGEEGFALLKANLEANPNVLFANREELVDYMASQLEIKDWEDFLARLDSSVLVSLLTREETKDMPASLTDLEKLEITIDARQIARKETNEKNVEYIMGVFYCLAIAYWRVRSQEGEYRSKIGELAAYTGLFSVDDKTARQNQCDRILSAIDRKTRNNIVAPTMAEFLNSASPLAITGGLLKKIYVYMRDVWQPLISHASYAPMQASGK